MSARTVGEPGGATRRRVVADGDASQLHVALPSASRGSYSGTAGTEPVAQLTVRP